MPQRLLDLIEKFDLKIWSIIAGSATGKVVADTVFAWQSALNLIYQLLLIVSLLFAIELAWRKRKRYVNNFRKGHSYRVFNPDSPDSVMIIEILDESDNTYYVNYPQYDRRQFETKESIRKLKIIERL